MRYKSRDGVSGSCRPSASVRSKSRYAAVKIYRFRDGSGRSEMLETWCEIFKLTDGWVEVLTSATE